MFKRRLKRAKNLVTLWRATGITMGVKLQQTVSQLLAVHDQLMQLPETTRKFSHRSTVLAFLLDLNKNAAENDEISILML